MFFSKIAFAAASAGFFAGSNANPINSNATIISSSSSELYFGGGQSGTTADFVIDLLQATGQINWTATSTGHYFEIDQITWEGAVNATQGSNSNSTKRSLHERTTTLGDVGAYSATAACYASGSVMADTGIDGFIIDACDALVGSTLPPLAVNALRVWQSGNLADVSGIPSYVRFSTKLLTNGFAYDTTLCQEAMKSFDSYCQKNSGTTQGGEINVGKSMMFNADPTELSCNC